MRLEHLADIELRYDQPMTMLRLFDGVTRSGYGTGTGVLHGGQLKGAIRWTNLARFRPDGVAEPRIHAVIELGDGASALADFHGFAVPDQAGRRKTTFAIRFLTDSQAHAQLNQSLYVGEAELSADDETVLIGHIYRCVNELPR